MGTELKRSNYRLLGLVGQGQFGRVYCAAHRQTGRLVALKNLEHQRFPTHKFLRELRFLVSLQHPNIVTCQAVEHTPTGRCLVMDYCEGGTLRSLMAEPGLSLPQSLKLIADILAGLEHAHSRGVIHCDIKPENILLTVQLGGWTARISDFGIARLSQELTDPESSNTGSPAYMAPERFYGQYSLASDLYSVGILLFELLAGYRPFSGTPTELMSAHLNRSVNIPDSVPEVWRSIILRALQKLPARRFRSAAQMLAALQATAAASGAQQDPQMLHLPLLKPTLDFPRCPFQSQQQDLHQPLTTLATLSLPAQSASLLSPQPIVQNSATCLYRGGGNQVGFQCYEMGLLAGESIALQRSPQPKIWEIGSFKHPVQMLLPRPQGCFVVTRRSLYLLPAQMGCHARPAAKLILALEQDSVAAIEAHGRWFAALMPSETSASGADAAKADLTNTTVLTFQKLPPFAASMAIGRHPVQLSTQWRVSRLPQLLALDARHVAIVELPLLSASIKKPEANSGTSIRVMTRRGSHVGCLTLPLRIGQAILTPTPYRLLATDLDNPKSVLLIDLKPYRISRFRVELVPSFLAATDWGYILADVQGQLVFLDQDGHPVGQTQAPAGITAIATFDQRGLLIATCDGQQGCLHTVDLAMLGLDLLF